MTGTLHYFSFDYSFPATEPPPWAPAVERWYQLDAPAFGLPHAYYHWRSHTTGLRTPRLMIFASPDGSNPTDYDFALALKATGAASPSKFVHTLPNSRSSALLQVMKHGGPMICLQNDPATLVSGLEFALQQLDQLDPQALPESSASIWVLGVTSLPTSRYRCHLFQLSDANPDPQNGSFSWRARRFDDNGRNPNVNDSELLAWLAEPWSPERPPLSLTEHWEIVPIR